MKSKLLVIVILVGMGAFCTAQTSADSPASDTTKKTKIVLPEGPRMVTFAEMYSTVADDLLHVGARYQGMFFPGKRFPLGLYLYGNGVRDLVSKTSSLQGRAGLTGRIDGVHFTLGKGWEQQTDIEDVSFWFMNFQYLDAFNYIVIEWLAYSDDEVSTNNNEATLGAELWINLAQKPEKKLHRWWFTGEGSIQSGISSGSVGLSYHLPQRNWYLGARYVNMAGRSGALVHITYFK